MTGEGLQLKLKTIQSGFYYNQEKHPLYISLLSKIQSWQESDTFRKCQDENPRSWLFQQKRSQGLEDALARIAEKGTNFVLYNVGSKTIYNNLIKTFYLLSIQK